MSHSNNNNMLDINQSGFKKYHSTESALLSETEALRAVGVADQSPVLILPDLSATLDTVKHPSQTQCFLGFDPILKCEGRKKM